MKSQTVKALVVPAVGALFLAMTALGTSAFATDTVTPSPSASPTDTSSSDEGDATVTETATLLSPDPSASPTDTSSSDEGDVSAAAGSEGDVQAVLDEQQGDNANVQSILGDVQVENSDLQENDSQVAEVNNDNSAETASFTEDIAAANQAGENEDAALLTESASIVTSVTLPEVSAMVADDTEAHNLIVGQPTK